MISEVYQSAASRSDISLLYGGVWQPWLEVTRPPMTAGETPAVARHRLRLALREAREAKGLTQREVAKALDWSLSKVNRIESGEVTLSRTDLLALLELLGVTDPDRIQELTDEARAARRRGWWDQPKYREHLTPAMIQSLQFEVAASEIRSFSLSLIPGVLQIPEYTSAIIEFSRREMSSTDAATRAEVRQWRRQHLFSLPEPPRLFMIIDESALLREVGGPRVMAKQLYDLHGLISSRQVAIRITPLTHVSPAIMLGIFTIYTAGGEDLAAYRESFLSDEISLSPEVVHRHRWMFEQIWSQAMDVDTSLRLIAARAAAMRSAADQKRLDG